MATASTVDADFGTSPPAKLDGKKPGDRIQCVVVTPERTLFDELVEFVALPLYDGELGVLPGRAPVIGRLGFGELRTKVQGSTKRYFVDGGFAQIRDDVVTVLTNRAIPASLLEPEAAARELQAAQARRGTGEYELADKARAVARAHRDDPRRIASWPRLNARPLEGSPPLMDTICLMIGITQGGR